MFPHCERNYKVWKKCFMRIHKANWVYSFKVTGKILNASHLNPSLKINSRFHKVIFYSKYTKFAIVPQMCNNCRFHSEVKMFHFFIKIKNISDNIDKVIVSRFPEFNSHVTVTIREQFLLTQGALRLQRNDHSKLMKISIHTCFWHV